MENPLANLPLDQVVRLLSDAGLNLIVWDVDTKQLKTVESVCVNGQSVQLNVEEWGDHHIECPCQNCARERVKAKRSARRASQKKG